MILAGCATPGQDAGTDAGDLPDLSALRACPRAFVELSPDCETLAPPADVAAQPPLGFICIAMTTEQGRMQLMRNLEGRYGLEFEFPPGLGVTDMLLIVQRGEDFSLLHVPTPTAGFIELGQGFDESDGLSVVGSAMALDSAIPALQGATLTHLWAPVDNYAHLAHRITLSTSDVLYLGGGKPTDVGWTGKEGKIRISYALPVSQGFGMQTSPTGSCFP